MSPFRYSKVNRQSFDDDLVESQHTSCRRIRCFTAIGESKILHWLVTYFLLSIILLCQISILYVRPKTLELGVELNGIVPNFSTEKRIFHMDKKFRSDHRTMESINATRKEWENLLPFGHGFLEVTDSASHELPPPMHYPEIPGKDVFALAIFHQLHCLMRISALTDDLVMQIRNKDFILNEAALVHNDHCFDYIRNTIMCLADTTLEGQAQEEGSRETPGTLGTGAIHICRSFDEISAYAERTRMDITHIHR